MSKFPTAAEIADDVGFTEATLDDNMVRQPALVAHYGRLVADLQFEMDTNKQRLEIAESLAAQSMRDEAAEAGVKITESQINSSLAVQTTVKKARMAYNKSKADFEATKTALEALRHKKDMMIQIAVGRRSELENKIRGLESAGRSDTSAAEIRAQAKRTAERLAGEIMAAE